METIMNVALKTGISKDKYEMIDKLHIIYVLASSKHTSRLFSAWHLCACASMCGCMHAFAGRLSLPMSHGMATTT